MVTNYIYARPAIKSEGNQGTFRTAPHPRLTNSNKRLFEEHEHFIGITVDDNGFWDIRCSRSLKERRRYILEEAWLKLQGFLSESCKVQHHSAFVLEHPDLAAIPPQPRNQIVLPSRPRYPSHTYQRNQTEPSPIPRPPKRSRDIADQINNGNSLIRGRPHTGIITFGETQQTVNIRVDDTAAQKVWLETSFRAIQQQDCRTIAKQWIKQIHPKKQSTHPYNDKTRPKPPYWPPDVEHKEPDHINKTSRTELLCHIIMNTPQLRIMTDQSNPKYFYASHLLEALVERRNTFEEPHWPIIEEIIRYRVAVEQYLDGAYSQDFTMCLRDFGSDKKHIRRGPKTGNIKNEKHEKVDSKGDDRDDEEDSDSRESSLPACDTKMKFEENDFIKNESTADEGSSRSGRRRHALRRPRKSRKELKAINTEKFSGITLTKDLGQDISYPTLSEHEPQLEFGNNIQGQQDLVPLPSQNFHHPQQPYRHPVSSQFAQWQTPPPTASFSDSDYAFGNTEMMSTAENLNPSIFANNQPPYPFSVQLGYEPGFATMENQFNMYGDDPYQDFHFPIRTATPAAAPGVVAQLSDPMDMAPESFYGFPPHRI